MTSFWSSGNRFRWPALDPGGVPESRVGCGFLPEPALDAGGFPESRVSRGLSSRAKIAEIHLGSVADGLAGEITVSAGLVHDGYVQTITQYRLSSRTIPYY